MDLTKRLRGKRVAYAATNGHILSIRLEDGSEVNVTWVDDNGRQIKGRPVVESHGVRTLFRGIQDLIFAPKG